MKNLELELTNINAIKEEYDYFKCTNGSLNNYLYSDAYYEDLMSFARTKLVKIKISENEEKVVGFFTLQLKEITLQEDGDNEHYQCIHLKYIAIDENYEHQGIGTRIINYIAKQSKNMSDFVGCRCLFIDALTEDIDWYRNRGFQFVDEEAINIKEATVEMFIDFRDNNKVNNYFNE